MKKIFYIFPIALLGLAACSKVGVNDLQPVLEDEMEADGPKVELTFSVPGTIRTKAMADKPDIQTMHVAVFTAAGKLKEFVPATLTSTELINTDEGQEARDTYTVTLTMAKTKRTLHFIANSPVTSEEDLETTTGEANVMNSLVSSVSDEPTDAYWQRKVLDMGITAYTYPGGELNANYVNKTPMVEPTYYASNAADAKALVPGTDDMTTAIRYEYTVGSSTYTVYKGDFICRDGSKVLDDTGYFASAEVSNIVAEIPLVRNFARITVSSLSTYDTDTQTITGSSNFVPIQFTVINTPTLGFVAPYDPDKKEFATVYTSATTYTDLKHDTIADAGYLGNMPSSAALIDEPGTPIPVTAEDPYYYAYERPVPTSSPVMLLVQGYKALEYTESETPVVEPRWFKIELTSKSGEYIPVYRGCVYDMEIASISGSDGYEEMSDALANPAVGDISGSTETANLTTISKGGLTLWVEYIGKTHVGAADDVDLRFKLYDSAGNNLSSAITLSTEGYGSAVAAAVTGYTAPAPSSGNGPDGRDGWYETTVTLAESGNAPKKTNLVVTGKGTVGGVTTTLYRKVVYTVMTASNFTSVTNDGLVTDVAGDQTTVTAVLPPNLPFSMFPLHLAFESNNNNINPVGDLPVQSGPSLFETGNNSFYFVRTVNWTEYDENAGATISATFATTKDNAVTGDPTTTTIIRVGDTDGFFNSMPTTLTMKDFGVSPTHFTVNGTDTSVQFEIAGTASIMEWDIVGLPEGVRVSSDHGTSSATVTMTFPENTTKAGDADAKVNTYTATVNYSYTAGGKTVEGRIDVEVKQNPQMYVAVSKSFTLSDASSLTVTDDHHSGATVTLTHGNGIEFYNSTYSGLWLRSNGDSGLTLTFAPAEGITIAGISFDYNESGYRPGSIQISGGATGSIPVYNDSTSGSWTGSSTESLVVTFTRRNRNSDFRLKTIEVAYSYWQ